MGKGEGESKTTVSKVSVVMGAGIRPEDSAIQQCIGYGIYYGRGECTKKNARVSLCFSHLNFFKQLYFVI
jgi:hypothetical protein